MKRKIIRDLIVPPTRVRHALARVFFHSGAGAAALCAVLAAAVAGAASPLEGGQDELAIDRGKPAAAHHDDSSNIPGDPASMIYFDFEGPVLYNPGEIAKDHTIVVEDGLIHVFFISYDERMFGHATSTDLHHWTIHEPILYRGPEEWDHARIWAPCVVPLEGAKGSYLMYYTGMSGAGAQRTGLAYSSNGLWDWYKAPGDLLEPFACDPAWCEWTDSTFSHFRDPFFFTDGGKHYISNTARAKNGNGAIALSESDGFFDWRDAGPMYIHNNWHLLESSQVIKYGGKYRFFFTEEGVGGTSYMASDSLRSGWNIAYRLYIDAGHAPEVTAFASGDTIFSRHTAYEDYTGEYIYTIRFDTLFWSEDRPVVYREPPLGKDWTKLWGTAFVRQPVFGDAFAFRGDTVQVGFEGNWWIGTAEAFNGPLFGYRPGTTQGDEPRGAIRSKTFTVTGRSMSLLVGGGDYPDSCWVALHLADDASVIYTETGRGVERMDRRFWNLEPYMGNRVYIEIVDDCASTMGHINVDAIRESPFPYAVEKAGHGLCPSGEYCTSGPGLDAASPSTASSSRPVPRPPKGEVVCNPNPCNPSTIITFSGCTGRTARVAVFSIDGRRICDGDAPVDADGTGAFFWDGRSSDGREVSSGVYAAAVFDGPALIGVSKLVVLR